MSQGDFRVIVAAFDGRKKKLWSGNPACSNDRVGPEALPQDQNLAETAHVKGKEPEQQAVSENAVPNAPNTRETVETTKEKEYASNHIKASDRRCNEL